MDGPWVDVSGALGPFVVGVEEDVPVSFFRTRSE